MDIVLPDPSLTARPLDQGDVAAVHRVFVADESSFGVSSLTSRDDITSAWARPAFQLETMSLGVVDDGRLVGVAEVYGERAQAAVDPAWTGRGIGSALARWTWAVARAAGRHQVGQSIDDRHSKAAELFRSLGYVDRWSSWIFTIDVDDVEPMPRLGDGFSLRQFGTDDAASGHRLIEDAFSEWPDREPTTFESWRAAVLEHPAFCREATVIAECHGEPVGIGVALDYEDEPGEGWIEQLAVSSRHRGNRLGRAILTAMVNAFAARGCRTVGLSTDSRTGARSLYEHVGMEIAGSYTRWSKKLPVAGTTS